MEVLPQSSTIRRDREIDGWNVRIYFWSRSPWVLLGIAAAILLCGIQIAWHFRATEALAPETETARLPALSAALADENPDIAAVLAALKSGRMGAIAADALEPLAAIRASALPEEAQRVALACWESLQAGEPTAELLWQAHAPEPLPHANEAVGDFHRADGNLKRACAYFAREARCSGAGSARRKHIDILLEKNDLHALALLASDPEYRTHLSPHILLMLALHERRWGEVARTLLGLERELYRPVPTLLTLAAGITWMIVALQAIRPPGLGSFRFLAPWCALALGFAGSWAASFAGLWQEEMLGLTDRGAGEFGRTLLYAVLAAAPRDEFIKLAAFLPLLPLVLRRRSRLEMLMLGGCVGLGFAVRENLLFFQTSGAEIGFGRFLTASFLHLAATGVAALALCEVLLDPQKKAAAFCGTLWTTVVAHGFYDAFMEVPRMQIFVAISMVAFLLLSLSFVDHLRLVRDHLTDQISMVATLVMGLSVLTCVMFVSASANLGFTIGLVALGANALGLVAVVLLIYWHLGGLQTRLHLDEPASSDSAWTTTSSL
jgi:protease PrsW